MKYALFFIPLITTVVNADRNHVPSQYAHVYDKIMKYSCHDPKSCNQALQFLRKDKFIKDFGDEKVKAFLHDVDNKKPLALQAAKVIQYDYFENIIYLDSHRSSLRDAYTNNDLEKGRFLWVFIGGGIGNYLLRKKIAKYKEDDDISIMLIFNWFLVNGACSNALFWMVYNTFKGEIIANEYSKLGKIVDEMESIHDTIKRRFKND